MRWSVSLSWMLWACTGPSGVLATKVAVPTELAGAWRVEGQLEDQDGNPGMSWMIEIELADGSYVRTGYPPWTERATIQKIEREGRRFDVHVTDHVSNGSDVPDGVVTLELSEDGSQVTLGQHTLDKVR